MLWTCFRVDPVVVVYSKINQGFLPAAQIDVWLQPEGY